MHAGELPTLPSQLGPWARRGGRTNVCPRGHRPSRRYCTWPYLCTWNPASLQTDTTTFVTQLFYSELHVHIFISNKNTFCGMRYLSHCHTYVMLHYKTKWHHSTIAPIASLRDGRKTSYELQKSPFLKISKHTYISTVSKLAKTC